MGLAIAGIGGVASSKPVATAVVGPFGLAVGKNPSLSVSFIERFDSQHGPLQLPLQE